MVKQRNARILVISDIHFPYEHPDTFKFLKAIKKKYKPDRIVLIGDEIDGHSYSFHEHNPDLLGPGAELETAIDRLKVLYGLFPTADVLESNHGSLLYRKGVVHGIPRHAFKTYNAMLEAPRTWKWHRELVVLPFKGSPIYFCHSKGADCLKNSQVMAMNFVQGHYHEKYEVRYWANNYGLFWGVTTGCLINDEALAYNYNKVNLKRPIIGCTMIENGHPFLLPMLLDKKGRWTGELT